LKEKLLKLFNEEFTRNLLTMVSGNALAQAIPIIASVFIARMYAPENIGAYTFFITIVNTLSVVAALKYNEAIVLSKYKDESIALFFLSIISMTIFCLFSFIFIWIFKDWILHNIDFPLLNNFLYLLPLAIFLMGLFTTFNFLNNYNKQYKVLATTRVTQNLSMSLFQILSFNFSLGGLVFGYVFGLLLSVLQSYRYAKELVLNQFNLKKVKYVFKKHIDFAKFYMPTAFVNKLSYALPIILLPMFYDMSVAGYYSYSTLIVLGPMGILSSSMQQVFYQKIASMHAKGENLYEYVKNTYEKLFLVGILPHLFLFLFAPLLFRIVFGVKWEISGEYTRYLMPWFFMIFLNSSVSSLYVIKKKQKEYFFLEIIIVIIRYVSLIIGYYFFKSGLLSIILYGLVGFMYEIFIFFYFLKISKNEI
jgi:O-antigen/teichoic acid export membrane protein